MIQNVNATSNEHMWVIQTDGDYQKYNETEICIQKLLWKILVLSNAYVKKKETYIRKHDYMTQLFLCKPCLVDSLLIIHG